MCEVLFKRLETVKYNEVIKVAIGLEDKKLIVSEVNQAANDICDIDRNSIGKPLDILSKKCMAAHMIPSMSPNIIHINICIPMAIDYCAPENMRMNA